MIIEWLRNQLDPWREVRWVGKVLLLGIGYETPDGQSLGRAQMWGVVSRVDAAWGVEVELKGKQFGRRMHLPPEISIFKSGLRGEYELASTGETIRDPDYVGTVVLTLHDPNHVETFNPSNPPVPGELAP